MAASDPRRFAGKNGIESGPVPIRRWRMHHVCTTPYDPTVVDNRATAINPKVRKGELPPWPKR